jgi:hypothetical protein
MRQHGHLVNTPFKIGIDQAIWFQSRTAYIRPKPTPQRHQRFKEYPHNRSQPFNRAITAFGCEILAEPQYVERYFFPDLT